MHPVTPEQAAREMGKIKRANNAGSDIREILDTSQVGFCNGFLQLMMRTTPAYRAATPLTNGLPGPGIGVMRAHAQPRRGLLRRKSPVPLPRPWSVRSYPVGIVGEAIPRNKKNALSRLPEAVYLCEDSQFRLGKISVDGLGVAGTTDLHRYGQIDPVEVNFGWLKLTTEHDVIRSVSQDPYGREKENISQPPIKTQWYEFQQLSLENVLYGIIAAAAR